MMFSAINFWFVARPHPNLLPQEKELLSRVSVFPANRPANPAAGLAKDAARVSPSPWGEGRVKGERLTKALIVS